MRFQLRWPIAAAAMLAAVLASAESGAQPSAAQKQEPRVQLTPAQKQEMRQHYEKATRAYDVQKYGEAIDEYQRAYEIGGDPAMLYNIGQAHRLADQLPEAVRFYRRYLQRSPNARNRDDVDRKIADLERTIEERRKAAVIPPPAVGEPAAPAPPAAATPVMVAPPQPGTAGNVGAGVPAAPSADDDARRRKRLAAFVLLGGGAALLATAGVTGKMASDKAADLTDASNHGNEVFDPAVERDGKALNLTAIVTATIGGAAVVTGAVLLVLSRKEAPGETRALVAPSVGRGSVGAVAMVRF
jgi:tetratricopeptide (TPR) repeat protein